MMIFDIHYVGRNGQWLGRGVSIQANSVLEDGRIDEDAKTDTQESGQDGRGVLGSCTLPLIV
jgi:hypothetical protein